MKNEEVLKEGASIHNDFRNRCDDGSICNRFRLADFNRTRIYGNAVVSDFLLHWLGSGDIKKGAA